MSTKGHPSVSEYMKRNYPIRLDYSEEDACWFASHPDLPECLADGGTQAEALTNLEEAREVWFQAAIAAKKSIPNPTPAAEDEEYGGNFMVRGPSYLHRVLKGMADRQRTSMNKLVLSILSTAATVSDLTTMPEIFFGSFKMQTPTLLRKTAQHSGHWVRSTQVVEQETWGVVPLLSQQQSESDLTQRNPILR